MSIIKLRKKIRNFDRMEAWTAMHFLKADQGQDLYMPVHV